MLSIKPCTHHQCMAFSSYQTNLTLFYFQGFWSLDQAALLKPVEIKDSDVARQHKYQQKM